MIALPHKNEGYAIMVNVLPHGKHGLYVNAGKGGRRGGGKGGHKKNAPPRKKCGPCVNAGGRGGGGPLCHAKIASYAVVGVHASAYAHAHTHTHTHTHDIHTHTHTAHTHTQA